MTGFPLRFGVKVGQDVTADELRYVWQTADSAGFDHVFCLDLFAAIYEGGPDRPIFEGWALQAAAAVTTTRARVGALFSGNTHRPPWLLAKLAVTVDHLSGGRLEFGIGAGYEATGHRMYDIPLEHRIGRLDESLECLKLLWTQERTDFQGRYYTLRDAIANPKPVQKPHPPIWMGAAGDLMLRVVARHADVWHYPVKAIVGTDQTPWINKFRAAQEQFDQDGERVARDVTGVRRCIQVTWNAKDPQALVDTCATWLEEGCTEHVIYLQPRLLDPPGVKKAADAAAAVLPELQKLNEVR